MRYWTKFAIFSTINITILLLGWLYSSLRNIIGPEILNEPISANLYLIGLLLVLVAGLGTWLPLAIYRIHESQKLAKACQWLRDAEKNRAISIPENLGEELTKILRSTELLSTTNLSLHSKFRAAQEILGRVLDSMNHGVIVLDKRGKILAVNNSARQLFSIPGGSEGRDLIEFSRHPAIIEIVNEGRQGRSKTVETDLTIPTTQQVIRAIIHTTPQINPKGQVVAIEDVSEIRKLATIRQDFVANVSHELRTPVSIIRAHIETILNNAIEDTPRFRSFLAAIDRSSFRLDQLVSDLLDLSRIETGNYKIAATPLLLSDVCKEVLISLGPANPSLSSRISLSELDFEVLADHDALLQVLVNLVDNALKYDQSGGTIEISAFRKVETVHVEILDQGPGIEQQHRKRIFERFYRVDPGRSRAAGGTGLGLSIVKHLTEAMGGEIGVEPGRCGGSKFWITLPTKILPKSTEIIEPRTEDAARVKSNR